MKKFIVKLLIFFIPIILFSFAPLYILVSSGENFLNIDEVVKNDYKYIIGYAYNENNYRYLKWLYLKLHDRKAIWALGSSRVLQFREEMFDKSFYNAGYTISSIADFKPFIESIPEEKYPVYLIIGLDQWMFNEAFDNLGFKTERFFWETSFTFFPKLTVFLNVYKDLFRKKYGFNVFSNSLSVVKIGLNANVNNTGFSNDGSMYYGKQISDLLRDDPSANDYKFENTLNRIKNGDDRFQYADKANKKAFWELRELLEFCKEKNIFVIGFLPPFPDRVYLTMELSGKYGYLKNIYENAKSIFGLFGYELYDFSTVSSTGSSDAQALDGFHGGEVTYQKMLIKMLEVHSILTKVARMDRLKNDLANKINDYIVYSY